MKKEIASVMDKKAEYSYNILWHRLIDKNMTKRELARQAGVSESTINNMKHGNAVSYRTLKSIAQVMEMSIEDLIESSKCENTGEN